MLSQKAYRSNLKKKDPVCHEHLKTFINAISTAQLIRAAISLRMDTSGWGGGVCVDFFLLSRASIFGSLLPPAVKLLATSPAPG